mmetsp:Transcript_17201/g.51451  ORF Transcript_17201/g.51451 Transcript_17201/m.51451 type:complete len:391 (+) Transcript_17201:5785-6957(+)
MGGVQGGIGALAPHGVRQVPQGSVGRYRGRGVGPQGEQRLLLDAAHRRGLQGGRKRLGTGLLGVHWLAGGRVWRWLADGWVRCWRGGYRVGCWLAGERAGCWLAGGRRQRLLLLLLLLPCLLLMLVLMIQGESCVLAILPGLRRTLAAEAQEMLLLHFKLMLPCAGMHSFKSRDHSGLGFMERPGRHGYYSSVRRAGGADLVSGSCWRCKSWLMAGAATVGCRHDPQTASATAIGADLATAASNSRSSHGCQTWDQRRVSKHICAADGSTSAVAPCRLRSSTEGHTLDAFPALVQVHGVIVQQRIGRPDVQVAHIGSEAAAAAALEAGGSTTGGAHNAICVLAASQRAYRGELQHARQAVLDVGIKSRLKGCINGAQLACLPAEAAQFRR